MPPFPKRPRNESPAATPEPHSPGTDVPDLVSSGDEDEASVSNNEDNEIGGGWRGIAELCEAAMANELNHRMAAVSVALLSPTLRTSDDHDEPFDPEDERLEPLTLRTSDDHAWPLVPGVHGPLEPIPHDMSLAPLADDDARGSTTPSSSCHEGDELAKDVVAKLKRHPLCQNAWFLPSRGSFKILRTDKKYFEVGIPDVQKLQKKAKVDTGDLAWQPFETTVIQTYAKALGVLNAETNMALEPFLGGVLNAETNKALETKNPEFGIDLGTKKPEETMPRRSQRQRLLTESWVGSS